MPSKAELRKPMLFGSNRLSKPCVRFHYTQRSVLLSGLVCGVGCGVRCGM